jgi:hypothetical protein
LNCYVCGFLFTREHVYRFFEYLKSDNDSPFCR